MQCSAGNSILISLLSVSAASQFTIRADFVIISRVNVLRIIGRQLFSEKFGKTLKSMIRAGIEPVIY